MRGGLFFVALICSLPLLAGITQDTSAAEPIHLTKDQALQLYQMTVKLNVYRAELFRECGCAETHQLNVERGVFVPLPVVAPLNGNNPLDP